MAQTTFNLDKETGDALEEIKKILGVTTNAAALKRMIALTRLNAQYADENNIYTLRVTEDKDMAVPLRF
jgi:hypothetical protein